jgi:hypothetical protein
VINKLVKTKLRNLKYIIIGLTALVLSLSFVNQAYATTDTYSASGNNGLIWSIVTISPTNLPINTSFIATGDIQSASTTVETVSLTAKNNGASPVAMIPATLGNTVVINPSQTISSASISFTSPATPGTYPVEFTTNVDILPPIYVKVEVIDTNTNYSCDYNMNNCTFSGCGSPQVQQHDHYRTTERASFYSDPAGTMPLDVTGRNLRLNQGVFSTNCNGFGYCQCDPPSSSNPSQIVSGYSYDYSGFGTDEEDNTNWGPSSCDVISVCASGSLETYDGSSMSVPYQFLAPPPVAHIFASPTYIYTGDSSEISWWSTNATSCNGTGFSTVGATSGSTTVYPSGNTTYSVTCTGPGGSGSPVSIEVIDQGPVPPMCNGFSGPIACPPPSICSPDPFNLGFEQCLFQ